ncbi:hypothetical protein BC936DRAFT_139240 [Jimgerdemannia flammicorona]|uniref:Uncharacterized protein n=1 Tax=Jimgerdemannia flammicorona TaxID=994334 RepID=A0A433BAB6_9FUNG|nr:hypothetical protein BC936DRAFT_139240 [Jimgerdemannia flammicorona]
MAKWAHSPGSTISMWFVIGPVSEIGSMQGVRQREKGWKWSVPLWMRSWRCPVAINPLRWDDEPKSHGTDLGRSSDRRPVVGADQPRRAGRFHSCGGAIRGRAERAFFPSGLHVRPCSWMENRPSNFLQSCLESLPLRTTTTDLRLADRSDIADVFRCLVLLSLGHNELEETCAVLTLTHLSARSLPQTGLVRAGFPIYTPLTKALTQSVQVQGIGLGVHGQDTQAIRPTGESSTLWGIWLEYFHTANALKHTRTWKRAGSRLHGTAVLDRVPLLLQEEAVLGHLDVPLAPEGRLLHFAPLEVAQVGWWVERGMVSLDCG